MRLSLSLLLSWPCLGLYDEVHHIASARLYGNVYDYAYYFLDLSIGSPPQRVSVIVDTGSSITGFPCKSCEHCGNHIDPLFEIAKSSTASWIKCSASKCHGICSSDSQHCTYRQSFTEGSSFRGWWFEDLVRLGDLMQQNPPLKASLGCHKEETRLFYTQKANGIMGIRYPSSGAPTLLQQLLRDREHINEDIFTMCIAENGGRLTVGGTNTSYHQGEMTYIDMELTNGFFNVQLSSVSVDGQTAADGHFGSTVIDSGTTWSYFGSQPYRAIRDAIEDYCSGHGTCGRRSGSCYEVRGDLGGFPTLRMSFGKVETVWVPKAYLYRRGTAKRWCYSFQDDGIGANTVLGASWMMHQDVMFDIPRKRVGVVAAACPEYQVRPQHDLKELVDRGDLPARSESEAEEPPPTAQRFVAPPTGLRVQATSTKPKRFNIGIVWAGMAAGICLATGFIGIVAAACGRSPEPAAEKSSGRRQESAREVVVGHPASEDEEGQELLASQKPEQSPSSDPYLKVE